MFPLNSILVILCHLITSALSETVLDQYSNQISNGFSKIRNNAQNNFINAGYTAHNSLNEIHDNTHDNFNKLLYKTKYGFSDIEDRQGLNNLANLLRRIRGSLRTPNVRQILGDFLSRPGVARALFLGSTGVSLFLITQQTRKSIRRYIHLFHNKSHFREKIAVES